MFSPKVNNLLASFVLPILVWQSFWINNIYATNLLNFLIIVLFIVCVLIILVVQDATEEQKLEMKVKYRNLKFNNEIINYLKESLDWGVLINLIAFGSYINAVIFITCMLCSYYYKQEIDKA